ncbi:hypothetical protein ASE75_14155 [Sphingomonas sp. Leaf17]|uniref:hypothetical protein n=1 Tax=Sphingomonas sp. Leaf17 TaxID=1735683 RepID=UPI0006FF9AB0|nr:hypothetical protein [Sphingomonas sp. Leaf17]KQM62756.1 hypothetical protein ASE75_14155 [Sphingomonas sp. Leaf17]
MKTILMAVALTVTLASPANAAMDVNTFLTKVAALKAKGMRALFSSDIGLLKREAGAAVTQIDAEKKARAKAGQPPLYCSPEGKKMSSDEMIAGLQEIPAAQRGMSLKDGFLRVIARRNPCP